MIDLHCPECREPVQFSDGVAGLTLPCPKCRCQIEVPKPGNTTSSAATQPPPTPAEPRQSPANPLAVREPRNPSFLKRLLGLALSLVLLALVAYGVQLYREWIKKDSWIYVDNISKNAVEVLIDGKREATVGPGKHEIVKCHSGNKRVQLQRGNETLYDQTHQLAESSEDFPSRYLLNPGGEGCYWHFVIQYGVDLGPDSSGLPDLSDLLRKANEDPPFRLDDLHSLTRAVVRKAHLLEPREWYDLKAEIGGGDYILKRPPPTVEGLFTDTKSVLGRLDKADYDLIKKAQTNENPTRADLVELVRRCDVIFREARPVKQ
jgi:hypothetical protein